MADDLKRQRARARAHAAPRGVGRHGAAGRARHQEPADADPAVGRARAARQHRSRPAALAGARRVRARDPHAGDAAAADRRRVLELRVVADGAAGADVAARRSSRKWSRRTARGSAAASPSTSRCPTDLPLALIDRTLFARAMTNVIENALHAMPGGGRLTIRAAARPPVIVVDLIDTGVGMDAGRARADLRALLLHEGHRHRPRPDDREAEHRIDRRNDRPEQRAGRGHDGDDYVPLPIVVGLAGVLIGQLAAMTRRRRDRCPTTTGRLDDRRAA